MGAHVRREHHGLIFRQGTPPMSAYVIFDVEIPDECSSARLVSVEGLPA